MSEARSSCMPFRNFLFNKIIVSSSLMGYDNGLGHASSFQYCHMFLAAGIHSLGPNWYIRYTFHQPLLFHQQPV